MKYGLWWICYCFFLCNIPTSFGIKSGTDGDALLMFLWYIKLTISIYYYQLHWKEMHLSLSIRSGQSCLKNAQIFVKKFFSKKCSDIPKHTYCNVWNFSPIPSLKVFSCCFLEIETWWIWSVFWWPAFWFWWPHLQLSQLKFFSCLNQLVAMVWTSFR